MPLVLKLTLPRDHNFTFNYIRKVSNDFLFEPLMRSLTNSTGISKGEKYDFKMQLSKILSETTRPRAFIFGILN